MLSTTSINAVIRLCAQNHHLSLHQPVTKGTALLKAPPHIPSGNCPNAGAEGPFQPCGKPSTSHTLPYRHSQQALGFPHPHSSPNTPGAAPPTSTNREISFSSHTLGHLLIPSSDRHIFTFPNNSPSQKARLALAFLTIHFSGSRK